MLLMLPRWNLFLLIVLFAAFIVLIFRKSAPALSLA